jgi:hypothetical protein
VTSSFLLQLSICPYSPVSETSPRTKFLRSLELCILYDPEILPGEQQGTARDNYAHHAIYFNQCIIYHTRINGTGETITQIKSGKF